jgi:hypothetical protein
MTGFRQLNREYDDMLESQYQKGIEEGEKRNEFVLAEVEVAKASPWSEQVAALSVYLDNFGSGDADEIENLMMKLLDHPLISKVLDEAYTLIAENKYDNLLDEESY